MTLKRPRVARIEHDQEVWIAEVGKQLRQVGKMVRKPRLGFVEERVSKVSSATVLEILESSKTVVTDGKGGTWAPQAQVHQMEITAYFEDEAE